jgi:proteic killer suppression protein
MSIQDFSCADTRALFETGKSARFANVKKAAERKLAQLDAAPSLNFMKTPPGNDLKEYDGAWHVRINDKLVDVNYLDRSATTILAGGSGE